MSKIKMLIVCLISMIVPTVLIAQEGFDYEITGKIPGAEKIYLAADEHGAVILDSLNNPDGSFNFKGKSKSISLGALIVRSKERPFSDYFKIFIEPGKITVEPYRHGRQIKVFGTTNNEIMTNVEKENEEFFVKVVPMYDKINYASMQIAKLYKSNPINKDSVDYYVANIKEISKAAEPMVTARAGRLKSALEKYPNTYFAAGYALNTVQLDKDEMSKMYAGFNDNLKNSSIGKEWRNRLFPQVKNLEVGDPAPDFTVAEVKGGKLSLSDFAGKYVLLDFWATWCVPCRAANPHMIELYNKYKVKGFEIIGISDDDNNVAGWKKAIEHDRTGIWNHVLRNRGLVDEEGESMDLSNKFNVGSYPTLILIDREGNILQRFDGEKNALDSVLAGLFTN